MKTIITITAICFIALSGTLKAQNVSDIRVQVADETLIVTYNLEVTADIEAFVSFDGGVTWRGPLKEVSGAIGNNIAAEKDKIFIWNVVKEVGSVNEDNTVIKIVATPKDAPQNIDETEMLSAKLNIGSIFWGGLMLWKMNVYKNDIKLQKWEVRDIMQTDSEALYLYNKSVRQRITANITFWAAVGALGTSIYFLTNSATYDIYGQPVYDDGMATMSLLCSALALGLEAATIALNINSNINKIKSVRLYNDGLTAEKKTGMNLRFGIIGNGVGMALNF